MKIKPCPFCGSNNLFVGVCYVTCNNCHTAGPFATNKEEAVKLWNKALRPELNKSCSNCRFYRSVVGRTGYCEMPVDPQGICIAWKPYMSGITEKSCASCYNYDSSTDISYCIQDVRNPHDLCEYWCKKKEER